MLSTTADHALRAVLFLGAHRDAPVVSADEIAHAIGAPSNYLSKTLNALTKAGITASTPGRYGGFSLAVPAHRLTVHDVVKVFDSPDGSPHCLLGTTMQSGTAMCRAQTLGGDRRRPRDGSPRDDHRRPPRSLLGPSLGLGRRPHGGRRAAAERRV